MTHRLNDRPLRQRVDPTLGEICDRLEPSSVLALNGSERRVAGRLFRPRSLRVGPLGLFTGGGDAAVACLTRRRNRSIRIVIGRSNEILQALLHLEQLTQPVIDVAGLIRRKLRHQRGSQRRHLTH
jgi:hypothetical protein